MTKLSAFTYIKLTLTLIEIRSILYAALWERPEDERKYKKMRKIRLEICTLKSHHVTQCYVIKYVIHSASTRHNKHTKRKPKGLGKLGQIVTVLKSSTLCLVHGKTVQRNDVSKKKFVSAAMFVAWKNKQHFGN